jgi:hypothetical protein
MLGPIGIHLILMKLQNIPTAELQTLYEDEKRKIVDKIMEFKDVSCDSIKNLLEPLHLIYEELQRREK